MPEKWELFKQLEEGLARETGLKILALAAVFGWKQIYFFEKEAKKIISDLERVLTFDENGKLVGSLPNPDSLPYLISENKLTDEEIRLLQICLEPEGRKYRLERKVTEQQTEILDSFRKALEHDLRDRGDKAQLELTIQATIMNAPSIENADEIMEKHLPPEARAKVKAVLAK